MLKRAISFSLVFAVVLTFCGSAFAAAEPKVENSSRDGMTVTVTTYSEDHVKSVVESDDLIATTTRDGNNITITEFDKLTGEEKTVKYDLAEFDTPVESVPPRSPQVDMQSKWMSYHYPGDGYITWLNNGAYVLILQNNQIYTTTGVSSTLRGYVNAFVSNIRDADEHYQEAVETLIDLVPIVGNAKMIAELIGLAAGVGNNEETWLSILTGLIGIGTLPDLINVVRSAMNANSCHDAYVDAWYDAEPLCVPWG